MSTATFDPARYKNTTRAQWEAAAAAWDRWDPTLSDWLGAATERMLDLAGVGAGGAVLDVAAGAGGQTLAAARRGGGARRGVAPHNSPPVPADAGAPGTPPGLRQVAAPGVGGGEL